MVSALDFQSLIVVDRSGARLQYGSTTWLYMRESGGTDF